MRLLLETASQDLSSLNVCPVPFISVLVSEVTIVLRSIFFNYSFGIVEMDGSHSP